MEHDLCTVGQSVVIKGDLTGKEDLTIEGQVEGKVELENNVLTIGLNGTLKGEVLAKVVLVLGKVTGNITATEQINIGEKASVQGDLVAPRLGLAEGARVQGRIDIPHAQTPEVSRADQSTKTTVPSTVGPVTQSH